MSIGLDERVVVLSFVVSLLVTQLSLEKANAYRNENYLNSTEEHKLNGIKTHVHPLPAYKQYLSGLRGSQANRRLHQATYESSEESDESLRVPEIGEGGVDEEKIYNIEECGLNWLQDNEGLGEYIAGGYSVDYGDFPSFVRLEITKKDGRVAACGGTLITRQHVLTAAHCIANVYSIVVRPSIHYFSQPSEPKYIASHTCNINYDLEGYQRDLRYDAGIVRLTKPVTLNRKVQLACLPNKPMPRNAMAIAVGLGVSDNRDSFIHRIPLFLQALPLRRRTCRRNDRQPEKVCFQSYKNMYTGDTCSGDSGGPLIMREGDRQVVAAITSYGPPECHPGTPGYSVNTDVYTLRKLIINSLNNCRP